MKTIVTILLLTASSFGFSQNIYLKISEKDKLSVSYPPGTTFELKNDQGNIVLKDIDSVLVYKIHSPHTLEIFPSYKQGKDIYQLTNGKIELVSNLDYMNSIKHKKGYYQSNGVTLLKSTYTKSSVNENETNVALEFSNGVMFFYKDGKVSAKLNDNEVDVKGRYLVYSDSGVVKISYNPKIKELWWAYEAIE